MRWKNVSLKVKLIFYMVMGVLLVLASTTAMIISTVTTQEEALAYQQAIEMARSYANEFNGDMKANQAIGKTIATSMSNYDSSDRDEVNNMLNAILVTHPTLLGTYVAYEPNAFDSNDELYVNAYGHDVTGRFIPYWNKMNGTIELDPLLYYDTSDYYQLPKKLETDVLTEPYYYEGVFIVSYASPIMKNGTFIGIGGVDVSLYYLDDVLSNVKAFDTGYAFMTSNSGMLLSHPYNKQWIGNQTLYDFGIDDFSHAADDIKQGKSGHVETIDQITGKKVVMFYEPIRTGNFSFVLVVPKDEIFAGVMTLRTKLLFISMAAVIFMAAIAYLIALSVTSPIKQIVAGFKKISDDAVKGKLDTRASNDVEIDFREIPHGLNEILDAVITPVRDTIRVTNALAKGELETRSKLDVQGEFKQLADTLDDFAESLDTMIKDSNSVLTAVQNNDFSREIHVHGEGDFRILTEGIDRTRETLGLMMEERRQIEQIRKKEIHHRIKNNLQVISSLLDLESDKFHDHRVIEAFRNSQNRVISMALVHEELYRSEDMESIDFSDYIIKLVNDLSRSYILDDGKINVKVHIDAVFLDMDVAIPLGMIVNELVSNSLKHAFKSGDKGDILIDLSFDGEKFTLVVGDNGAGFPEDVNFRETESLGLQLVTTLVDQIDGTIELERTEGTRFRITFK
ncbi:MAG: nitrate/nitrite sensor protein NarX [Methanomethylovorans sp. PtaU1.Bin093]|uniref:histidine kinase dimerization/phosphoacceptor domain -containing protein n=1 Tax=Methanomethylovorans sp. PtaU1.Bin093 TaxID=1811679 RepID=UPI0009C498E9|nr:histidine kinase dimerization/phosphoacceptor domain -containing protein [Methanomethylovorans sp. PtaU1.Bin093]OPY19769.1 MAG: nitrate/nitrite sensor protein NarX [Methanomethylovorans sp. PtaU1.Bin093]